jgi:hypothetical protein
MRGAERQKLPDAESSIRKVIDKQVRFFSQHPLFKWAGKSCQMQQNSGAATF